MNIFQKAKMLLGLNRVYTDAVDAARRGGDMSESKNIMTSKLFWFNAAIGMIGFLQQAGVHSMLPEPWGPALAEAFASVNIVLRYYTTKPVTVLPKGGSDA